MLACTMLLGEAMVQGLDPRFVRFPGWRLVIYHNTMFRSNISLTIPRLVSAVRFSCRASQEGCPSWIPERQFGVARAFTR